MGLRKMTLGYIIMALCLVFGLLLGFVIGYNVAETFCTKDIAVIVQETEPVIEMLTEPPVIETTVPLPEETEPSPAEIEAAKWAERAEEYPTATSVWLYLTEEMGCNDYVAAGIMGNMMAECGGQTLKLNWKAKNSSGHYGLCQWSPGHTAVKGANLQEQLDFMAKSFPKAIDQWGSICYKKGFDYEDFMAMEDARKAAYAFCVIYERPGPGSYEQRRDNAEKAYKYFTS